MPLNSSRISAIFARSNFVEVNSLFALLVLLLWITMNLHSWGRLGNIMLSLDCCQTQLVLPFILILPVNNLTKDTSGVIWRIAASFALVNFVSKYCNRLPLVILLCSTKICGEYYLYAGPKPLRKENDLAYCKSDAWRLEILSWHNKHSNAFGSS